MHCLFFIAFPSIPQVPEEILEAQEIFFMIPKRNKFLKIVSIYLPLL
jgi:hypothetical protein